MNKKSTPVCIAAPRFDVYSETFVQTHLNMLPFDLKVLSGSSFDRYQGASLLGDGLLDRVRNLVETRTRGIAYDELRARRRIEWLKDLGIKAVLAEFGVVGAKLAETCKKADLPLVVHFHGADAHSRKYTGNDNYNGLFEYASAIIGVSRAMCSKLILLGAPEDRLHYVPYYVNPDQFSQCDPQDQDGLLAVGRFVEKKAPHLTILSFAKVAKSSPGLQLDMVGDGPLLGPCKWLVRSLGLENQIIFHGVQSHEWICSKMKQVKGFLQHSVEALDGDCEGTPVSILEAQCCGLPVIATSHTGICDVVSHEKTGFLCKEGDLDGMAENIESLLAMSSDTLKQMSSDARNKILSEFGRDKTIDRLAEVIHQVIVEKEK